MSSDEIDILHVNGVGNGLTNDEGNVFSNDHVNDPPNIKPLKIPAIEYPPMTYIKISSGTLLFRADEIVKEHPTPHLCSDTGKTGVYFSAHNEYLAETMCTEYMKDLYISCYVTIDDIIVTDGKYGFTRKYTKYPTHGWSSIDPEDNVSHYDDTLWPIDPNTIDFGYDRDSRHAELFLIESDLKYIKFVDSYKFTVGECIRKWYRQSWFEETVNNYVRPLWVNCGNYLHRAKCDKQVDDNVPYFPAPWKCEDTFDH